MTDVLYEIDPVTGLSSHLGNIGFDDLFALGFTPDGTLYGVSDHSHDLVRIDTASGAGTSAGTLRLGYVYDIAADPVSGQLYALSSGRGGLYTIDLAGPTVSLVAEYDPALNLAGLAFASVPEPTSITMLGLAALSLARRRRRR